MMKKGLFLLLFFASSLSANPSGHKVLHGNASISSENSTLNVRQKSKKAIIEWQKFSIEKGETANFILPSAKSSVLNRVVGKDITRISGDLKSNGKVYLINEHGVIISPSGRIVTNGFIASTLELSNENYLNNNLKFSSQSSSEIENNGSILAQEGDVYLIAKNIVNKGLIEAKNGEVNLLSAETLLLDKNHNFAVEIETKGFVDNSGLIKAAKASLHANGNNIFSLAINQGGIIDICALSEDEVGVLINANNGRVDVHGKIKAAAQSQKGGRIHLLGKSINIQDEAIIDSSDLMGGGEILIGGDYQGKNPNILNADVVFVEKKATINASAIEKGDGGKVILWAERENVFLGSIVAKGGQIEGNGGFIEISVKGNDLIYKPTEISTKSKNGKTGTLLLDPSDINITAISPSNPTFPTSSGIYNPSSEPNPCNLYVDDLTNAISGLGATNVTVSTTNGSADSGTITVSAPISWTSNYALTLIANSAININAAIGGASTQGDITFTTDSLSVGANIQSTGALTIVPYTTSRSININTTGSGTLDLSATTLNYIQPGFSKLSIGLSSGGLATGSGTTTFAGTYSFSDAVEFFGNNIVMSSAALSSTNGSATLPSINLVSKLGGINITSTTITANNTSSGMGIQMTAPAPNISSPGITLASSSIVTSNRSISLTGSGGSGSSNFGISITGGSTIQATGSGAITLNGTGGSNTACYGIYMHTSNVYNNSGDLTINGVSNTSGHGVFLTGTSASKIGQTGVSGNIFINGFANATTSTSGIDLNYVSIVTTSGNISLSGTTSSAATLGRGIISEGNTIQITSSTGTINLSGRGSGGTQTALLVGLSGTTTISSGADITLYGDFSTAASTIAQTGIVINGSIIATGSGKISVTGKGGTNTSSGGYGCQFSSSGMLNSQNGNITVAGTGGGPGGSGAFGVYFLTSNNNITSINGDVNINGTAIGTASTNYGIRMSISSAITVINITGSGNLTMTGIGSGTGSCHGIYATGNSTTVPLLRCSSGNMTITGTGIASGYGLFLSAYVLTSTGKITLSGTSSVWGVYTTGSSSIGGATTSGDIIINADKISIATSVQSTGALYIYPITASQNININTTGSGTLDISNSLLTTYLKPGFSKMSFGLSSGGLATGTGTTNFTGTFSFTSPVEFFGGNIVLNSAALSSTSSSAVLPSINFVSNNGNISLTSTSITANDATAGVGIGMNCPGASGDFHGINLNASTLTTTNRSISLIATGGTTSGNSGIYLSSGSSITTSGSGDVTLNGNGGSSGGNTNGIYFTGGSVNPYITAGGNISLTGTTTTTGSTNGIYMDIAADIQAINSTGTGSISLTGTGSGTTGNGINAASGYTSAMFQSTSGDILLTGTGAGSGYAITLTDSTITSSTGKITLTQNTAEGNGIAISGGITRFIGGAATSGDISIFSDRLSLNIIVQSTGNLFLHPVTPSTSIGIGDSSTGSYKLDSLIFSQSIASSFANVSIGQTTDSVINIDFGAAPLIFNYPLTILGKDITINASNNLSSASGKNVTLQIGQGTLGGILTLNSDIAVSGGGILSTIGGANNDTFNIGPGINPTMTITGNGGTNSLLKADGANTWQLSGANIGNINSLITFTQIQNLTGGSGNDSFNFTADATFTSIDGGMGNNTLTGPNFDTIWTITGSDSGTINPNGVGESSFTRIQNLQGSTAQDTFKFNNGATLTGFVDGGDIISTNTLNYSLWIVPVIINKELNTASNIALGFSKINNFVGNIIYADQNVSPSQVIQLIELIQIANFANAQTQILIIQTNPSSSSSPLYSFDNTFFDDIRLENILFSEEKHPSYKISNSHK